MAQRALKPSVDPDDAEFAYLVPDRPSKLVIKPMAQRKFHKIRSSPGVDERTHGIAVAIDGITTGKDLRKWVGIGVGALHLAKEAGIYDEVVTLIRAGARENNGLQEEKIFDGLVELYAKMYPDIAKAKKRLARQGYVQPGRVGKKARSLYLDVAVATELDAMATDLKTDTHSLIVDLIAKAVAEWRDPAKRAAIIKARIKAYEAELLGSGKK